MTIAHHSRPALTCRLMIGAAAFALATSPAAAQMPGFPVLQNAFANPGITLAGDYATGKNASAFGAAAAWAPGTGKYQLSVGVGSLSPDQGKRATTYGARLATALFSFGGGSIGAAPFVGVGGATVSSVDLLRVPVGVGIGWRHALGTTRGIAIHAAPFYDWNRASAAGTSRSRGMFRVSAGADVTLIRKLAATVGFEGGTVAKSGDPGATGAVFGAAISYAFR